MHVVLNNAQIELNNKLKDLQKGQSEVQDLIEHLTTTQERFKDKILKVKATVAVTGIPLNVKEIELQHNINELDHKVKEVKGQMKEEYKGLIKEKKREEEAEKIISQVMPDLSSFESRLNKW